MRSVYSNLYFATLSLLASISCGSNSKAEVVAVEKQNSSLKGCQMTVREPSGKTYSMLFTSGREAADCRTSLPGDSIEVKNLIYHRSGKIDTATILIRVQQVLVVDNVR